MSLEQAREVYETISENEDLQKEFEGLASQEEVIDKALEVAETQGIDVSRGEIEALFEELAEKSEELDEEELENVAGGVSACAEECFHKSR